jgi:hypothetical protein
MTRSLGGGLFENFSRRWLLLCASNLRLIEGHPYGDAKKDEAVGAEGEDGFDASSRGAVYEERGDDCTHAGFEESFAEGAGVGDADADLLHQSRWTRIERGASTEIKSTKIKIPTLSRLFPEKSRDKGGATSPKLQTF